MGHISPFVWPFLDHTAFAHDEIAFKSKNSTPFNLAIGSTFLLDSKYSDKDFYC